MATSRPIKPGDVIIRLRPRLSESGELLWSEVGDVTRAVGNESRDDFALRDDFPELRGIELLPSPGNFYFNQISRVIFNCVGWDLKSQSYFRPRRDAIENGTAPGLHVQPAELAEQPTGPTKSGFREKLERDIAETIQARLYHELPKVSDISSLNSERLLTMLGAVWWWYAAVPLSERQSLIDRFAIYRQLKPLYDIADGQDGECELPEDFRRMDPRGNVLDDNAFCSLDLSDEIPTKIRREAGDLCWVWRNESRNMVPFLRTLGMERIMQKLDRVAEARVAALQTQRTQPPSPETAVKIEAEISKAVTQELRTLGQETAFPHKFRAGKSQLKFRAGENEFQPQAKLEPTRWNQLEVDLTQPVTRMKIEAKPVLKLREMSAELEVKIQAKEAPDAKQSRFDLLELDLPAVPVEPVKPAWKAQPKTKPTPAETRTKALMSDVSDIKEPLELVAAYARIGMEVLNSAYPEKNN